MKMMDDDLEQLAREWAYKRELGLAWCREKVSEMTIEDVADLRTSLEEADDE